MVKRTNCLNGRCSLIPKRQSTTHWGMGKNKTILLYYYPNEHQGKVCFVMERSHFRLDFLLSLISGVSIVLTI